MERGSQGGILFLFLFSVDQWSTCLCFYLEIDTSRFCYVWEENAVLLPQYVPDSGYTRLSVSCLYGYGLFAFMVTAVALVIFFFPALPFWLLLFTPFCLFIFSLSVALWYGFCSGNPGGWRSFILHDVMQQPDNPKTVLLFFYYFFYFLPLDSDSYFLLPCSPIFYILFAARAVALPVCLSAITNGVQMFLFQLVWAGSCSPFDSRFSIRCSLLYPVPWTGFSDSHLIPWSMVKHCFNFLSSFSWFWFWGLAIINMCVYFILDSPSIVWIIGLCTTGGCLIFIIPQFQY